MLCLSAVWFLFFLLLELGEGDGDNETSLDMLSLGSL